MNSLDGVWSTASCRDSGLTRALSFKFSSILALICWASWFYKLLDPIAGLSSLCLFLFGSWCPWVSSLSWWITYLWLWLCSLVSVLCYWWRLSLARGSSVLLFLSSNFSSLLFSLLRGRLLLKSLSSFLDLLLDGLFVGRLLSNLSIMVKKVLLIRYCWLFKCKLINS